MASNLKKIQNTEKISNMFDIRSLIVFKIVLDDKKETEFDLLKFDFINKLWEMGLIKEDEISETFFKIDEYFIVDMYSFFNR